MDRRSFLINSAIATGMATASRQVRAQLQPAVPVELTLRELQAAPRIPATFTGLSYELAQLTDPSFFSASNRDLVAHFRLLSRRGVLRIGGNTSEFCWFKADASTPEPKLHVPPGNPDANWMPHELFAIAPQAIDALAGFLQATGWQLIYGLNFGNSTPQRAAAEAAYVASKVGERLEFFQIGNEPDFYHDANNGTRPAGWDFPDYLREWTQFADAITAQLPHARFGGPDVGSSSDWITRFGDAVSTGAPGRVVALTGHYYAEGPPNDPRVTTERLLRGNPQIALDTNRIEAVARAEGLTYRMTEGNSCYRGGKPGMSNAFAAALWAGDYLLQLASLGCAGVNLHGGSAAFLTAGLGGHTPGMDVAARPSAVHNGFYTPISSEPGSPVKAMPVFYGMLLADQFAGCTALSVEGGLDGVNGTAYAAWDKDGFKVALFNKDVARAIDVTLRAPYPLQSASAWRLHAPALDATEGVTLAGSKIEDHARWSPLIVEPIAVNDRTARIRVEPESAALVFLHGSRGSASPGISMLPPIKLKGERGNMFIHIFGFRWKPHATEADQARAARDIRAFDGKIPGLLEVHAGPNLSPRGQGYTFAGMMKFTDKAAADAYTVHPAHLALLAWLVPLIDPVELDFEG